MREVKIWLNKPQLRSRLSFAKEEYDVWGRATGKTQGPIANRSIEAANAMPRGATGIIGNTYMQLLDRTLPPLIKAWEKLGYIENVHFWIRKRPPEKYNIPSAIYPALTPEHTIYWWNGHVFHLISMDRPGLANGKNLDAIIVDEARFINHQRYMDDIAPTNRGNVEFFGDLAMHHMVTMCTDMPIDPKGRWILEKESQMDTEKIAQIVNIQLEANRIEQQIFNPNISKEQRKYLNRKLREFTIVLNELRKDTVYYSEASSLDNIEVLGVDQIKQWRRELTWPVFQAAILNERTIAIENGFYYLFDRDVHAYDKFDYSFVEGLGIYLPEGVVNDCRRDEDLIKGKPIDVAFDYNSAIKSLVCGQETRRHYRVLKSMYVTRAQQKVLNDLVDEFCTYYKPHNVHEVNYYYDNTALVSDATRLDSLADVVVKAFVKNGWTVNKRYIGQQPMHETRYRMWEAILQEKDPSFMPVRLNRENCDSLITSMQLTGVRQGKNGFEKDKRPEQNSNVKPQDAPHLGDALDTLYIGKFKHDYGYADPIAEMITSS